jgi:hypothetical protein
MRLGNVVALSLMADFIPWLSLLSTGLILHIAIGRNTVFSAALLISGAMVARYGTLQKKALVEPYDEPASEENAHESRRTIDGEREVGISSAMKSCPPSSSVTTS